VPEVRRPFSRVGLLAVAAASLLLCLTPTARRVAQGLPHRVDDREFWSMVSNFSEPGGFFRSDNLVSNETTFQHVIPVLQRQLGSASAYLGVGPDQNFTYIVALKPKIAFIVDIRRQNMLLHLMYKALIELSPTRDEFLSRLFSREPPSELDPSVTAETLFAAFEHAQGDEQAFARNLHDIEKWLQGHHRFGLSSGDLRAIEYVYRSFYSAGPDIRYSFGRGPGWAPFPSYRDLMVESDAEGRHRSYLATEENYQVLRDLEMRNVIVPIVGDFAGPKALRDVAAYLRERGGTVTAFYTSNVEQYLFRGDEWQRFYSNVAALPIGDRSMFIRAYFNNAGRGGFQFAPLPAVPPTPRSVTLLNPIPVLLTAVAEGRIQRYLDVVELSK
jgi:hypothetical protein